MILPYRAKNPPERFPYVTLGLILLNTLVFALTSDPSLHARRESVEAYAVTYNNLLSPHLLTALFMHGSLLHLGGNMLFLWIFGPSLEGRLGYVKFGCLYLLAGIVGNLLHGVIIGSANPDEPLLGASGAIMGVAGGYLYTFPYSTIRVLWFIGCFPIGRYGVCNMQARWVVLLYIMIDVFEGLVLQGTGGVAHLAHLGGAATGLLMSFCFGVTRDNHNYSQSQAVRAEIKDYSLMSLAELEPLMQHPSPDVNLIFTYCEKWLVSGQGQGEGRCVAALLHFHRYLDEQADPARLAHLLLKLSPDSIKKLSLVFCLRLGSRLERVASTDAAARIYRRIYDVDPRAADTEAALFRLTRIYDQVYRKPEDARSCYLEMQRLFPNGVMVQEARRAMPHLTLPSPPKNPSP